MMPALLDVLLAASVRASLAAALVAAVLFVIRVQSSSVRHAAWAAVLAAMLAMPALPSLVPAAVVRVPISSPAWPSIAERPTAWNPPEVATSTVQPDLGEAVTPPESAKPLAYAAGQQTSAWPLTIASVYVLGVAIFAARVGLGLLGMRRVVQGSRALSLPGVRAPVYASSMVSVPLTTGVFKPRIILPVAWSTWPAEQLAAVLAHESSHIARRDPVVLFLACVNRTAFWFHPLAWWLERQLAITAEHACDEAGVRAVGSRRYAKVLLDMAAIARQRHGRVAWSGVGIDGAGMLSERIERVLRSDMFRQISRTRKAIVALGCVAAISFVVACRQELTAAPLKEDPAIAARLTTQKAHTEAYNAAEHMSAQQVAELEAALKTNPEDMAALRKLMTFYWSGQRILGWNEMIAARRPHLLWLIAHHPDSDLAVAQGVTPEVDPVSYAEAKKLWLAYVAKSDTSPAVLGHAAAFFQVADKPIAEQVLLRLRTIDPDGPQPRLTDAVYSPPWTDRLGELYALTILGSTGDTPGNVVRSTNAADEHSAYAATIRKKLDESTDAQLLVAAGGYLVTNATGAKVDFDQVALGQSYVERARQLDPNLSRARTILTNLRARSHDQRMNAALRSKEAALAGGEIQRKIDAHERLTGDEQKTLQNLEDAALSAMSDKERFAELPDIAGGLYMQAEAKDYDNHDPTGPDAAWARAEWARSKKYAQDVLALAPKFRNDPEYGWAVRSAELTAGTHALREGDRRTAVRDLTAAAAATPSADAQFPLLLEGRLVNYLLKAGERESVASYFERTAATDPLQKDQKLAAAAAIRAGQMPEAYQYTMTPH